MKSIDLPRVAAAAKLPTPTSTVEFSGSGDPIYPSPMCLAEGTAGVLAMIAAEFDALSTAQSGTPQAAVIDPAHALATISSMWVLKVDGEPAMTKLVDPMAAGQGVFQCADGRWLYLLSGFPHLVEKTMDVLGCSLDNLEAHVAEHASDELEGKLVDANLTGVVIRDHAQWLEHPQGEALRDQPAVIIEKIGDAPKRPLPESALEGLRILDATRVLAGPTCAKTLAALGADVLHVGSASVPDMAAAQADTGAGKRRAYVDLSTPEGTATMRALIEDADVFSQSYRAKSLSRRGLGPEDAAAVRPGIIYVTENAYGDFGPWREKRGFDGNVQAASGIHVLHNPPVLRSIPAQSQWR